MPLTLILFSWTRVQVSFIQYCCCSVEKLNMISPARRRIIFLVFIGFLFTQPEQVSGLRSIDLDRRLLRNLRVLKNVDVQELHEQMNIAPTPSAMSVPIQSTKRRARRGSDPIHNKCWHVKFLIFFFFHLFAVNLKWKRSAQKRYG